MRNRPPCPVAPVPGSFHRPPWWRPGARAALATGAVLALAAIAPPALAAPGLRLATAVPSRLRSLAVSGSPASAASATGRYLQRPEAGSRAVLWEQTDGHRYTMPAVAAPHVGWAPASGTRPAARAQPTLRLKVTSLAGQPASNVQVVLMNTDNAGLDPAPLSVNGTARVTVPVGDYSLFALFLDLNAKGKAVGLSLRRPRRLPGHRGGCHGDHRGTQRELADLGLHAPPGGWGGNGDRILPRQQGGRRD